MRSCYLLFMPPQTKQCHNLSAGRVQSASEKLLNTNKYDVITRCERDGEMVRRHDWRGRFIGGELNTRLVSMSFFEILILIEIESTAKSHFLSPVLHSTHMLIILVFGSDCHHCFWLAMDQ